jgi:hypothetical protein
VPPELTRLYRLLTAGLARTAELWPDIRQAYGWVHRAAHLLSNPGDEVLELRRACRTLLAEMRRGQDALGPLRWAIPHFLNVTKSYWPGLFHCYMTPDVPRTNNDLEHCFGSARYHERRATGRKGASPAMVIRGRVRLVAAVATRAQAVTSAEWQPVNIVEWHKLRGELAYRQEARRVQLRFRRDPDAYLRRLEERLLKLSLPS